jgi:uncharacterized membrane protein YccC
MAVFNAVVSVVLVLAALVTVWFAWQAGKQSAKAAQAADATVSALREIRAADAHDRRLRRLRDVADLVGRINYKAQYTVMERRCSEQSELAGVLGGLEDELPVCKELASEGQPGKVLGIGLQALPEVTAVLQRLQTSG